MKGGCVEGDGMPVQKLNTTNFSLFLHHYKLYPLYHPHRLNFNISALFSIFRFSLGKALRMFHNFYHTSVHNHMLGRYVCLFMSLVPLLGREHNNLAILIKSNRFEYFPLPLCFAVGSIGQTQSQQ